MLLQLRWRSKLTDTFVIADAHGKGDLVRGLLFQEGLLGQAGDSDRRLGAASVVQIGDLANCVAASVNHDLNALDLLRSGLIDVMLVGNHEHPYFGGPGFEGYWPDGQVRRELYAIRDQGKLQAAHAAGDILISHAGLTPWALERLGGTSAAALAQEINALWGEDTRHQLFTRIGKSRGGWTNEGGILWADWSEPKLRKLRQIVGHTVGDRIRFKNAATCIDLGCGKNAERIAGAWIRNSGKIETVIYETPSLRGIKRGER